MNWSLKFSSSAENSLGNLDRQTKNRIIGYFENQILSLPDPRQKATQLKGKEYTDLWKFRIGDYRVIASINNQELTILLVKIGHRSSVYKR